jgi:AcrR family transcriptional regulator
MLPLIAVSTPAATFDLRRAPSQERSRATFELLLQSAAELLEEGGLPSFNTNLLSERTGVSIRAIYRYFPNKHALIVELARRMSAGWRDALADSNALTDPRNDYATLWCGYIDHFIAAVRRTPGGIAVLQAMRADPELQAIDDATNAQYMRDIAQELTERDPRLKRSEAEAVAAVLIRSMVGVVDAALTENTTRARRMIELLKIMHVELLERSLRQRRPRRKKELP